MVPHKFAPLASLCGFLEGLMIEDNYLKKLKKDKLAIKMAMVSAKGEDLINLKKQESLINREIILAMIDKEMQKPDDMVSNKRKR